MRIIVENVESFKGFFGLLPYSEGKMNEETINEEKINCLFCVVPNETVSVNPLLNFCLNSCPALL